MIARQTIFHTVHSQRRKCAVNLQNIIVAIAPYSMTRVHDFGRMLQGEQNLTGAYSYMQIDAIGSEPSCFSMRSDFSSTAVIVKRCVVIVKRWRHLEIGSWTIFR